MIDQKCCTCILIYNYKNFKIILQWKEERTTTELNKDKKTHMSLIKYDYILTIQEWFWRKEEEGLYPNMDV